MAIGGIRSFDLQFFGGERTEKATPRKRQKTREEGQTCKSQDLHAATVILAGLFVFLLLGGFMGNAIMEMIRSVMGYLSSDLLKGDGWLDSPSRTGLWTFLSVWFPLALLCVVVGTFVMARMVGWHVSFKPFAFKFSRFNPVSGLKKIASLRSIVTMLQGIMKSLLLLLVIYLVLRKDLWAFITTMRYPLDVGVLYVFGRIWNLCLRMVLLLLILGVIDFAYQKWEFEKSIKMSKQEIKEEWKQMEGDPQIKRAIRRKQMEMARRRMMSDVPKSDVVITNPTHLSIAIQYDNKAMAAPVVVAKGEGFIALKIREIAKEHDVPIVEDKALARALFSQVEVGEEIPEEFYRAVAEVLAFVYRLSGKVG